MSNALRIDLHPCLTDESGIARWMQLHLRNILSVRLSLWAGDPSKWLLVFAFPTDPHPSISAGISEPTVPTSGYTIRTCVVLSSYVVNRHPRSHKVRSGDCTECAVEPRVTRSRRTGELILRFTMADEAYVSLARLTCLRKLVRPVNI